jgi:hypothetical protein
MQWLEPGVFLPAVPPLAALSLAALPLGAPLLAVFSKIGHVVYGDVEAVEAPATHRLLPILVLLPVLLPVLSRPLSRPLSQVLSQVPSRLQVLRPQLVLRCRMGRLFLMLSRPWVTFRFASGETSLTQLIYTGRRSYSRGSCGTPSSLLLALCETPS